MWPGPQPIVVSMNFYSCWSSHMITENKPMVVSVWSAMVSRFCVRSTSKRWFWEQCKWPCNMIHWMPCRSPCRLYIHLAFTYPVGPSSIVWSELGPSPPFPPMRVLEVQWSRALNLQCEVAFSTTLHYGRGPMAVNMPVWRPLKLIQKVAPWIKCVLMGLQMYCEIILD